MKLQRIEQVKNIDRLAKIIYVNFMDLQNQPDINFSIEDITSTLSSAGFLGWLLLTDDGTIVGYMVGELKDVGDGRFVYFLSYFYIIKKYRGNGLGSKMMLNMISYIQSINVKFIMLISSTLSDAFRLYSKLGFVPDPIFKLNNNSYTVLIYYL
jgi:ribosomal protein S18 acetylase RimI-like enzyme